MSQQIENQIVKMQFDNANFEKNVQQSMSTIEKLKHALHFDKVDMTPLQQAFSETEATATRAGFHIRDIWLKVGNIIEQEVAQKVVNAGKKIFNALTFEGINDGFKEYELKMGSIQTIMAGTGESLATVNRYLDELNKYSDQTIYSFSDMTQNIGKFTNAGVKLKDAVAAIKGIANEAAISGANANEASRAMYNFAQALSAGYVKLIDWKSIENANMATVEFKETLLEMASACGTVKKDADGMYQVLTENAQGKTMNDIVSGTKNFNDSLQYQWMTTEVLTKALEIYATDIRQLSDAEKEEYEAKLKSMGFTEEQVEKFEQLGIKAANSATEIKTFTMLIDTLKEAIGSGWAMTWQYFIGDFEQAKALWTDVGTTLNNLIDNMNDARNAFLKEGLQTGWEAFTTQVDMAIPESEKFRDILVDLARQQGILTKEQYVGITSTEELMKSFHEFGWVTGDLLTEAVDDYTSILKSMSKEEREAAGVSDAMLSQLELLNQKLKTGAVSADEFAKKMNELGGRENIIRGIKNLFESLLNVLRPIGQAFDDVFGVMDPNKLFDMTVRFREFTEEMKVSEDAANTLKTSFTIAFTGIKTAIGAISTGIKGLTKLILPTLNLFDAIFGLIGKIISALTGSKGAIDAAEKFANIGDHISDKYLDAMQKLADFINKVADAIRGIPDAVIFTKIHDGVESAIRSLREFWNSFVNLPIVKQMIDDFNKSIEEIERKITPVITSVEKAFDSLKEKVKAYFSWDNLNKVLTNVYNKVQNFISVIKDLTTRVKNFFSGLKEGKSVVESFRENFGDIIERIKELKANISNFFEELFKKGDSIETKFDLEKIQKAIHDFVTNITPEQVTMLAVAGSFMLIALNLLRLSNALHDAVESFTGIGVALKNVINSYIKKQKSTILQIAESIVIVAAALLVLSKIPKDDLKNAEDAMIAIAVALGVLTGVLTLCGVLMNKLGGGKSMVELASGLAIVAGSFMIAALSLKVLETIDLDGVLPKILVIGGILAGLEALSLLMSKLDKFNKGSLTVLALSASLLVTAEALAKIGEIPEGTVDHAMSVMLKMMLGLAALVFASGKVGIFSAVGIIAVVMMMDKILPMIENLVNYNYDEIEKGIDKNKTVLLKLGGVIAALVTIGAIAGNRLKGASISLLALAGTFAILVGVTKLVSMLKPKELAKGEEFLWSMAGIIALIELCSMKASLKDNSAGFIKLAITMGILLGIAKLASMMEVKDLVKGELAVLGLVGLIGAMVLVAKQSANSEGLIKSVSGMIFALSLILAEVAVLSIIPLDNMVPALTAVLAIIAALALLANAVSKNNHVIEKGKMSIKGAGALIFSMAMVGVLGYALYQISKQSPQNVAAAAGGLVAIIVAVAALSKAVGKVGEISKGQLATVAVTLFMVAAIAGILAALTAYLKQFNIDPNTMVKAAGSIAIVLLGITPALLALSMFKAGTDWKSLAAGVLAAIGALASVAIAIGVLSNLGKDGDTMIDTAIALAIGLIAICAPMAVLGAVGKLCQSINIGSMATIVIAAMVTLGGVATAIWALSTYGNPETMVQSAQALAIGLFAISVPIAVLGAVGALCSNIGGAGIGAMAVATVGAIGSLAAVAYILYEFANNMDLTSIQILNEAIPILATAIGGVAVLAVAIAAAGALSGGNFAGVLAGGLAMVEAIAILGLIIAAIAGLGAALNNINGAEESLIKGLDFLVIIAGKIGEAAGALIGGIGVGITSQLDPIADNLNSFSEKMIIFSNNMAKVNKDAVDGCKNLAAAMVYLAAAEFLEGLGRLIGFGTLDVDFKPLGIAMSEFATAVQGVPQDAVNKASICSVIAARLAEVCKSLDPQGGVAGWLFGERDMSKFAQGVAQLGIAIMSFCNALEGIDESAVQKAQLAADVSQPLIELTQSLVSQGGLWQKIAGEKNLSEFGLTIVGFVVGMKKFISELADLESIAPNYGDMIKTCAEATTPLVDLANGLENMGGALGDFLGNNDLDLFGDKLVPFAKGLYTLVAVLNAMASEVPNYKTLIINVADATTHLVDLANSLENMGGAFSIFTGDNTLDKFGKDLAAFGYSLAEYATATVNVRIEDVKALSPLITDLINLAGRASSIAADSFSGLKFALASLGETIVNVPAANVDANAQKLINSVSEMISKVVALVGNRTSSDKHSYALYGSAIVNGIIDGINSTYSQLDARIMNMIREIIHDVQSNLTESTFNTYGRNVPYGIGIGISNSSSYAIDAANSLGRNVAIGLADGINENSWRAIDAARDLAERVNDIIQSAFDEHSPSKIAYGFGKFYDLGLANGIRDFTADSVKSTENLTEDVISTANNIISTIADVINGDIDTEPVIRPVLDTSDITDKARNIGSLFNDSDLQLAYNASGYMKKMSEAAVTPAGNTSNTYTYGGANIYITARDGESADQIADKVINK